MSKYENRPDSVVIIDPHQGWRDELSDIFDVEFFSVVSTLSNPDDINTLHIDPSAQLIVILAADYNEKGGRGVEGKAALAEIRQMFPLAWVGWTGNYEKWLLDGELQLQDPGSPDAILDKNAGAEGILSQVISEVLA